MIAAALTLLLSFSPAFAGESPPFMKEAPEVPPLAAFAVPERARFDLDNGMKVVFVEDHRSPLVTVRLAFRGAARLPGRGAAGTAEAFAELLTGGTARLKAREIAEEADAIGGALEGGADDDDVTLGGFALKEHADRLFALLDACAFESVFPDAEVALRRENMLEELRINRGQSGFLASTAFARAVFGEHPYGVSQTEESIGTIAPDRLRRMHARAAVPSNMLVLIVGDLTLEELDRLLKSSLGSRTGIGALTVPPYPVLGPDSRARRRVLLLDRPGSEQAALRVGHLAPREDDPRFPELAVANMALGGAFTSRLNNDIREKRGYTYGVYSGLSSRRSAGIFSISLQTRTGVVKKSLKLIVKHLKKLLRRGISDAELKQAKNQLVAGFVREFETQKGIADALLDAELSELPDDYLDGFVGRVQAVTRDEALAAAREHLDPERAALVVVGDAAALARPLKGLASQPLTRVDENGVPISP